MRLRLRCLRLSTPRLQEFTYPLDAEAHFEELQKALSPWFDFAAKKFMADMKNPYHCPASQEREILKST